MLLETDSTYNKGCRAGALAALRPRKPVSLVNLPKSPLGKTKSKQRWRNNRRPAVTQGTSPEWDRTGWLVRRSFCRWALSTVRNTEYPGSIHCVLAIYSLWTFSREGTLECWHRTLTVNPCFYSLRDNGVRTMTDFSSPCKQPIENFYRWILWVWLDRNTTTKESVWEFYPGILNTVSTLTTTLQGQYMN